MRRQSHTLRRRYGRTSCPTGSSVQSLLFPRSKFTVSGAEHWAREHDFKATKVDVTDEYIRLRQLSPGDFKRMRTQAFGSGGVKAVVGWGKC